MCIVRTRMQRRRKQRWRTTYRHNRLERYRGIEGNLGQEAAEDCQGSASAFISATGSELTYTAVLQNDRLVEWSLSDGKKYSGSLCVIRV